MSREHVVPRGLAAALSASQTAPGVALTGQEVIRHRFDAPDHRTDLTREWAARGLDLTTKAVCASCNSGWLSKLESQAQPLAAALITGKSVTVAGHQQRLMATWAYKTVLLFQLVREQSLRAIPLVRYSELYRLERPPTDVRVWLAATQGGSAVRESSTEANLTTTNSAVPGFFSALALGNLLIICAGRIAMSSQPIRIGARADRRALLPVWPASVHAIQWPPETVLEDVRPAALVSLI